METLFELGEDLAVGAVESENEYCEHLPDNVLKNIFKYLPYQDICRCHLACKHIHKYLNEHIAEFSRPHLSDLIIESVRDVGWIRQLRLEFRRLEVYGTHACLKKTEFTEIEDESFEPISKLTEAFVSIIKNRCHSVIASGDVTFRYIVVDDDMLKPLMPFFEPTTGLFFDHCKIDVSVELLCGLLASSKCVKLGVNECQFVKSTLDDKILSSMSHCDVLALRWCKPKHLPGITYRTLLRWENQKRLPKEIDFEGMSTDFTTFELVNLIKAFEREHHEWFSSPNETSKPPPAEWNLGEVILTDNPYRLLHSIEGIEVRRSALISEDREEYEVLPSWASHIADDSFVVIEFVTRASSKRRHAPLSDNI